MSKGIAGARGFIGSYLARYIIARKPEGLRLLVRNTADYESPEGAEVFCGDLLSRKDCEWFAAGLKLIYYLAHVNTPVDSDFDLPNDALVNLVPLLNLLDAIQHLGTRPHIVYFSSGGAVYSPSRNRLPYRETDPCSPLSSYGIQKLAAEEYLRLAASKGYLTATVMRVGNAYGTLLSQHRRQGLIGVAVSRMLRGQPVRIFGNPDNVRDYVHLEDVCSMAERAAIPRREFTIVNVGSGQGHSVTDVLRLIEECHGRPLAIQHDESCGNRLAGWVVLDNTKAMQEFGWFPAIDLRSGIEKILAGWHTPSAAATTA
ncbi:MAG: NAD-dependent epimerase/dehydratase family protein [Bryobacteraceae bacterium]|jgi:UDP-glucose 4-epimerase